MFLKKFTRKCDWGGSLRRTVHYAQYWCKTRREMEGKL